MIYRSLSILFLIIFVISIICAALPLPLFKKEKPIIHVLLLDLSLSTLMSANEAESLYSRIESSIASNEYFVRGYFADKNIFMDEDLIKVEEREKKGLLLDWLKGGHEFKEYLNLNVTNLENAVRDAFAKWSNKGLVHVLIVSDGKENNGKLFSLSDLVKKNDIIITMVPILEKPEDVFVKDLITPENILVGKPFEIETNIFSTRSYKNIILQVSIGNNETIQKEVELKKGKNSFVFSGNFPTAGIFEVTTKILNNDIFQKNNTKTIQVKTSDAKAILIATDEADSPIAQLVSESKIISPIDFPRQVSELLPYNGIVIENIPWNKLLDIGKMSALKEYVSRGGKLFVSGGQRSFGFGDYMGSSLEEILPVKINPSGLVSMIVGIDISGSMEADVGGMRKIDVAINSLLDISKSLEANDELGVHLYNEKKSKSDIWIPLSKNKDFESIFNEKRNYIPKPAGGTFILPALQTIYDLLAVNERKMRIGVIITDGESQEIKFEEILTKFKDNSPPITVILIGADLSPESPLLLAGKNVFGAQWNPVNINAVGWVNLKDCFKEALKKIASGFSDEGEFKIYAAQGHPISRMIQPFDSPFKGIILKTGLKEGASALLEIDERFPLLAHRYLGSGEVISFQSGFYENWAGNWLKSAQGKSFQSMIGSWLQQSKNNPVKISIDNANEGYLLTVSSQLKSLETYAELHLVLNGRTNVCVRNSNNSWQCYLNGQEASVLKPNELYSLIYKTDNKEILIGRGILPTMISKEIFDIYESTLPSDLFPKNDKKWHWTDEKVAKIEMKSFQSVSNIKFFFFMALFAFLLAIFFRGRVG